MASRCALHLDELIIDNAPIKIFTSSELFIFFFFPQQIRQYNLLVLIQKDKTNVIVQHFTHVSD